MLALFLAVLVDGMAVAEAQANGIIQVNISRGPPLRALAEGAGQARREAVLDALQLEARISTLRSRVRRLLALHGLSRVVAWIVPLIVLACLADWLAHFDAGVRLTLLLALIGFAGWLAYRHVLAPLFVRFADLDIALRIEERWPGLNDRLASTVQFLKLKNVDDRFGSPELRAATVKQTLDEARSIDFRAVVEPRPVYRALAIAAAALLFAGGFIAAEPQLSRLAARRLFLPFGAEQWPQMTHLALLDKETPRKVARGEPFTLAVAVAKGDRVPSAARAIYRFENGETLTESLRRLRGAFFEAGSKPSSNRSRSPSSAGDDAKSVRDVPVRVVPPPAVKDLAIRLVPPAYTKLEPQTLAAGRTQVKAVTGTRVELLATATKPLDARRRCDSARQPPPVVGKLDASQRRIQAAFTLKGSNPFWFELVDDEGFKNREADRYEARAVADEAPRVVIDEPPNDRDVPATAVIPVKFTVDDDFGIHSARLSYKAATGGSEPTRDVILPLWEAGEAAANKPVVHQQVQYTWDLAPLKLPPGSVITFHADARDFDTIKGPNLGGAVKSGFGSSATRKSPPSSTTPAARFARTSKASSRCRTRHALQSTKRLRTLSKTDKVAAPLRENLKNAAMIQRQVSTRVTNKADGLQEKVDRFLQDLKNFKVDSPDARKQMEQMREGVARIRENHLEPAEQGLTRAPKNLGEAPATKPKNRHEETNRPDAQAGAKPAAAGRQAATRAGPKTRPRAHGKCRESRSAKPEGPPQKRPARRFESRPTNAEPKRAGKPTRMREQAVPAKGSLAESQDNQKAIADELNKMLDGLSEFENYRGVVKDAQNLLKEHEQVMKQTNEAAAKPDLMGKTPEQLTPEQKADLREPRRAAAKVAKGAQGLQEKMGQMAKRLAESDPLAAAAMIRRRPSSSESAERPGRSARPPTSSKRTRWARPDKPGKGPARPQGPRRLNPEPPRT